MVDRLAGNLAVVYIILGTRGLLPPLKDLSMGLPKINYNQENHDIGIWICKVYLVGPTLSAQQEMLQAG